MTFNKVFHTFNLFTFLSILLLKSLLAIDINVGVDQSFINWLIFYLFLVYIPLLVYHFPKIKEEYLIISAAFEKTFQQSASDFKNNLSYKLSKGLELRKSLSSKLDKNESSAIKFIYKLS